jgi:signal transduction histidine kinase
MFWKEKHTRVFLAQLLCIACLSITAALLLLRLQENRLQSLLFEHDARIASSLLSQGISEETAARAIAYAQDDCTDAAGYMPEGMAGAAGYVQKNAANISGHAGGETLLGRLGLEKGGSAWQATRFHALCIAEKTFAILAGNLFLLFLCCSIFYYLRKRDRIYREAIAAIENCGEDNFTLKLPELYDGTLYQLFARINFMAAMLKTRQETENKVKEFLKTTVSDISHQLKTPLAALSLYQEIILNEPGEAETVALFAEKSQLALARIEGLVQTLLKITRLDAGAVIFFKKDFDAKELVLEAAEELKIRAEKEGKKLLLSGDGSARVYCDPDWSREALGNLIKNALDHTEEGDRIRITWEQTPLMTRFIVTDTGEGIEKEDLHHIFKRFYRCENSRSRQGIGLGLSLVKSIVDGQGGTVSVQSEPGRETTFTLAFPN